VRWLTIYAKPFKLDDLIESLRRFDPVVLLVEDARGYGRQKGHLELYSGSEYQITFLPKVKVEVAIEEFQEPKVVEAVVEACRTGRIGDGKVLVREVRQVVAIR
jgi:nitrogen regulatory protein P-II 1